MEQALDLVNQQIMRKIQLEQFEGPLDLLLQLIESKKLDITEVALSEVTGQYLEILQNAEGAIQTEELADFLVIASRLLLLKSRAILPLFSWEDEEAESLESQLRMYKLYLDAAKVIETMTRNSQMSFARARSVLFSEIVFCPPPTLSLTVLKRTFCEIIANLEPLQKIPQKVYRKVMSLQEKIEQIQELIEREKRIRFLSLVKRGTPKSDIIVSFLALLELIKRKQVEAYQENHLGEIVVVKVSL